jgi:acetylornithine deacetylase/succinyl-diaminopimelate desuccinylase-like protein
MTVAELVATRGDELARLASDLVRAPSPNPPGDERAVATVLARYLAEGGFDCRTFEPSPGRVTLVATLGRGAPSLVLAAHTDTHPVAEGWTVDPFGGEQLADGRILGRGTTDNKGAVAAMAVALRVLAELSRAAPLAGRVLFVANADEETGGVHGIQSLCEAWQERPEAAIVAEPSGVEAAWEALWIGARGTSRFTVETRAPRTHSSLAGRDGVESAVEAIWLLLTGIEQSLDVLRRRDPSFELGSRLTVVSINGGEGWGVVPGSAQALCELRLLPGNDQDSVEVGLRAAFDTVRVREQIAARLEFAQDGLRWMAPSSVSPDAPIVRAAAEAWRVELGRTPTLGCFPGGTDARLFAAAGVPAVIAGPGALARAHQPDEFVTVEELLGAARLYATTAVLFIGTETWPR